MDFSKAQAQFDQLAELAKKFNICVVTATQISPIEKYATFNRSIPKETSDILILDYTDIMGE